ncbi:hypothetical protein ABS767_16835 [Sphingomonas sp. ST-64]|uniref:DUF4350 domain-containing protein n=1 Tax=Sphingomonas plantiphila TaxID=3163295 RepID=A0ABW8YQS8_9SPHN
MSESTANPFRTRTVLILIGAGVMLALGFLLVNAYGDRVDRQRSNIPSPTSRFATGFYGLTRLIDMSGGTVSLSGDPRGRPENGLLILTPHGGTTRAELAEALEAASSETAPVLIILPKWVAIPQARRPTREQRISDLPIPQIEDMLGALTLAKVAREKPGKPIVVTSLPIPDFRPTDSLQTVSGPKIYPLIKSPGGATVLGEVPGTNTFILADPDLLNNRGLVHRANARAAIALVAGLDPNAPGTVIFDTMLPFGAGDRNLLRLMFEPPFAGVTLALAIAALLAGLATLSRFGPVRREPSGIPLGKAALIENIVSLARRAKRTHEGGAAYADAVRDWAGRRLALPSTLKGDALDAHLDALKTTTPYAEWATRVRTATSEAELLHAAQKLDDWRKEVKA